MRAPFLPLLLAALPLTLSAQTVVAAGDPSLRLTHLLRGHPEGVILCLPSASGQSLAQGLDLALDQEAALDLQLSSQELEAGLPSGRELQALKGWNAEKPHWALLGPDGRLYAEGTEAPTPEALREAHRASGLPTRAELLRTFLKTHPDHGDALARLVLELRGPAERRTERLAPEAEPVKTDGKGEGKGDPKAEAGPILLSGADDARIWEEYAAVYARFLREGHWLDAGNETGPLSVAAPLSSQAVHSPRLRALADQEISEVEVHLRRRPSDARRWKVWLSLREASGRGRPSEVLAGLRPLPGLRRWPPEAAVEAFVEDARHTGDWRAVEPMLEASYAASQELLRDMETAAAEDAGLGQTGPAPAVQMGTYFGFGGWTGELALLVEAKLRLGKFEEADRIVLATYARVSRAKTAEQAAGLARECGADALAAKWERLGQ